MAPASTTSPRPGEDHYSYSRRTIGENPASPCTANTMTFGNRCLRCGWEPTAARGKRARVIKTSDGYFCTGCEAVVLWEPTRFWPTCPKCGRVFDELEIVPHE